MLIWRCNYNLMQFHSWNIQWQCILYISMNDNSLNNGLNHWINAANELIIVSINHIILLIFIINKLLQRVIIAMAIQKSIYNKHLQVCFCGDTFAFYNLKFILRYICPYCYFKGFIIIQCYCMNCIDMQYIILSLLI